MDIETNPYSNKKNHGSKYERTYLSSVHDRYCIEALKVSHNLCSKFSGMTTRTAPGQEHVIDSVHELYK